MSENADAGAVTRPDGTPGSASSPETGPGAPPSTGDTSRTQQPAPPAANQGKDEPIGVTPETSPNTTDTSVASSNPQSQQVHAAAGAGESSRVPQEQGEEPRGMEVDDVRAAGNVASAATMPAGATGGVPTPGDSKGVSVPSVHAAAGTSEGHDSVEAVKITSLAAPGKPDGEVDTRG